MADEGLHGDPRTLIRIGTAVVLIIGIAAGVATSVYMLESDSYFVHGMMGATGAVVVYVLWRGLMRHPYDAIM